MTKQEVIALIESLPNDVTVDDILSQVYFRSRVGAGLADARAGRTVSHEEVRRMVEQWLRLLPPQRQTDA